MLGAALVEQHTPHGRQASHARTLRDGAALPRVHQHFGDVSIWQVPVSTDGLDLAFHTLHLLQGCCSLQRHNHGVANTGRDDRCSSSHHKNRDDTCTMRSWAAGRWPHDTTSRSRIVPAGRDGGSLHRVYSMHRWRMFSPYRAMDASSIVTITECTAAATPKSHTTPAAQRRYLRSRPLMLSGPWRMANTYTHEAARKASAPNTKVATPRPGAEPPPPPPAPARSLRPRDG